jgi:D-alanyl-D-alanine carboxypeptidase
MRISHFPHSALRPGRWIALLCLSVPHFLQARPLPVHRLDKLLEGASRPRGGTAAAAVLRLRDGKLLWDRDSWRRMLPASTLKVPVAAALHGLLGGGTRLSTRLLAEGPRHDSLLEGDLVLEAGGDPGLMREGDGGAFADLAAQLRKAGLRKVQGALVVRDPLLSPSELPWPGSWDWDNSLGDCDGAPSAGIAVDGNCPGDF